MTKITGIAKIIIQQKLQMLRGSVFEEIAMSARIAELNN